MKLLSRIERLESMPHAMFREPLFIKRRGTLDGWRGGAVAVLRMPNETDEALKRRAIRITGSPLLISITTNKDEVKK